MTQDPTPPQPAPPPPTLSSDELDALFAGVRAQTTARSPGRMEALRELPWAARSSLGVLVLVLVATTLAVVTGLRDPLMPHLVSLTIVFLGGVTGIVAATRPAGRAWTPAWQAALAVPLLAPILGVLLPHDAWGPAGTDPMTAHLACGVFGGVAALVAGLTTLSLDRGAPGRRWRALGAASAGGAAGYVATTLHCPSQDPVHLFVAHAAAGLVLAGAFTFLRPPRPPRPAPGEA